MIEQAANVDLVGVTDQIDELSTRLILNGVASLAPADFERLSDTAADLGKAPLAGAAWRIAHEICAASTFSLPDLTRLVSCGLVELRRIADTPGAVQRSTSVIFPRGQSKAIDRVLPTQSEINPLAADEELIREFITESNEHLLAIESQLLILESGTCGTDTLNAIFRGFHTIKGLAGFLEFAEIQLLTHEIETLLDLARTSQLTMTPAIVDVLLESTDIVRQELAAIAQRVAGGMPSASKVSAGMLQRIREAAHGDAPHVDFLNAPVFEAITEQPPSKAPPPSSSSCEMARAEECVALEPPRQERRVGDRSSVRIDTAKLDQLMDMVGEMVISQTLIGHSPALQSVKDAKFQRNLTQLARSTADVQKLATSMRMVPIGIQFNRTARVVRDLARRAGKQIVFETSGEDTELDKTIAEQLSDPLLHMVRNSIDHGIESSAERIALGKDPTARIHIAAYHQSGQIVVAVSDDGRGLNPEKILAKARQRGLIQHGVQLAEKEIFLLIFEAGFSTAEQITDISGRGVGMDVVRRHVQKLRGRIDIQSKAGEGTTFFIKLPLTLAIIQGLVVVAGQQRYIIPMFSVREMFRPAQENLSTVQETGEMAMVRGRLLPIVRLHRCFRVEPRTTELAKGILIVAETEGRQFCLFVDDLIGKQEVVIKSLGPGFQNVPGIAGGAILGDGRVGLILDIDGIYKGRS